MKTFEIQITYFFALLALSFSIFAQEGEVISVTTFDKAHIAFGGEQNRNISESFSFPDGNIQISDIRLHFKIACPDGGCDDWDRYGDVDILVPTGEMDSTVAAIDTLFDAMDNIVSIDTSWNNPFAVKESFEIFRFITPYGGSFPDTWEWDWYMDVSDYRPLLQNEAELRVYIDTWVNPGWEVTLTFEFTEGTPEREPYKIVNLWNAGSVNYGDINNPIEDFLTPITLDVDAEAQGAKVRLINTGHGFGYTDNAAEFSPKTHKLEFTGLCDQTFDQFLWRDDCADNPLSPQAGTWEYNRAGWCPGNEVFPYDYDISNFMTPGMPITVDYNAQPYINLCSPNNPDCTGADCAGGSCDGGGSPYYIISSQLIYYKSTPQYTLDAQSIGIKNLAGILCENDIQPQLILRNNGAETLTSATILYRMDDEGFSAFSWSGELPYAQSAIIDLPALELTDSEEHTFEAVLSGPNGGTDEDLLNDLATASFRYGNNTVMLHLITDSFAEETSLEIKDPLNPTVVFHSINSLSSQTEYNIPLCLPNGCFKFAIYDTYGDGLNGAAAGGVDGFYELLDSEGNVLVEMGNLDFGLAASEQFCVESELPNATGIFNPILETFSSNIEVYPNPAKQSVMVKCIGDCSVQNLRLFNSAGQEVAISPEYINFERGASKLKINIEHLPEGLYVLSQSNSHKSKGIRLMIQH